MRHIFTNREVPHRWFHRSPDWGRNHGDTLYYRGDTIYSYGSHFPIARHLDVDNRHAVLMTNQTYSVSTARHINLVRYAIPAECPVFTVEDPRFTQADILASYQHRIIAECERAAQKGIRHTTRAFRLEVIDGITQEANRYCKFMGVSEQFTAPASLDAVREVLTAHRAEIDRAYREREAQRERERAARAAQAQELITQWLSGQDVSIYTLHALPPMLRIHEDTIQTSWGAEFPLVHAQRLLTWVDSMRHTGWTRNSDHTPRLGVYTVDQLIPGVGIRAGCHTITWEEYDRIRPILMGVNP